MELDWLAFAQVFAVALVSAVTVVAFYALGLRLLVFAGASLSRNTPLGDAGDHTEAETRYMQRNPPKVPVTDPPPPMLRLATVAAYGCFAVCASAVILGIFLLVVGH